LAIFAAMRAGFDQNHLVNPKSGKVLEAAKK
jgi:hypothetical protein